MGMVKLKPSITKILNLFIRRHPFFAQQSLSQYTTSERRKFERDVYDFARAQDLTKAQAKSQTIKARAMCGEEDYDSDNSALGDEVDDSQNAVRGFQATDVTKTTSYGALPLLRTKAAVVTSPSTIAQGSLLDINQGNSMKKHHKRKRRHSEKSSEISQSNLPEGKMDDAIQETTLSAHDTTIAEGPSSTVDKNREDRKVGRRERKKAKKQVAKSGSTAQDTLAKDPIQDIHRADSQGLVLPSTKGPNNPITDVEVSENSLGPCEEHAHEHDYHVMKSKKLIDEEAQKSVASFADLGASKGSAHRQQSDMYDCGQDKGASKSTTDEHKKVLRDRELAAMSKVNKTFSYHGNAPLAAGSFPVLSDPRLEAISKKGNKRNSSAGNGVPKEAVASNSKRKSNEHVKSSDVPHYNVSDFQSPMI